VTCALLYFGGGKNFFRFRYSASGRQIASDQPRATHSMKLRGIGVQIMRTNGATTAKYSHQRKSGEVHSELSGEV
jgi:hypothetical protein